MDNNSLNILQNEFIQITKNPETFLGCDEVLQRNIKDKLKQLYDFSKSQEIIVKPSDALSELLITNFDTEQIWQQIELQNDLLLTSSLKTVSKLLNHKNKLVFTNIEEKVNDQIEANSQASENDMDDDSEDYNKDKKRPRESDDDGEEDSDENVDLRDADEEDDIDESLEQSDNKGGKKSVVDDEFFKLDEMEKFLLNEEKKLNEPDSGNDSDESEGDSGGEEHIDLFKEDPEDDEEGNVRTAKFKDFFVAKEETRDKTKRNKFLEDMSDEETEEQAKSTYELRQERLQKKIDKLEEKAIREKPWTLKGEVTADNRPQNSLLEEVVEFDMTSRPAPVITEKTTVQLEDIIRQRIKDKVFDSVERKAKPIEMPLEYKKKLVLDQEKSKHSLAQIYEKEFLEQQAALDTENADKEEEEPELHKEVKKMMHMLFRQLDALSNFHFTPKPVVPELRVVNNLPAVSMEEVAPVTSSEAALLAPEEIRNKAKGDILGKSEKTATDKRRERRKKKQKQKHHIQQINKNLLTPGKTKQKQSKQFAKEVMKGRNVEKMDENSNSKSVKSSKAFFQQLQEQVQTHIGEKKQSKNKKKKNKLEAKKLKL